MKVTFLSTGGGLRAEYVNELRAKLGLRDSDVVRLVSWQPSRIPLPVDRHLVLGPHLRIAGQLATVQAVQESSELVATEVEEIPASGLLLPDKGRALVGAPTATPQLPLLHPRRMRTAVAWRVRRLKRAGLLKRAATGLTRVRRHPQFRKARGRLSPGVSLSFAAGCLRAGIVHDLARDSDLVVALDAASHRGAWTLAQRVHGPAVVIGIPAAKRFLEQSEKSAG